ncbi:MAG: serine/threonine-protein kinase [Myxococcota bacterium]|nr:serine/threonine-protein kinase [Myxococcota bacterium]
MTEPQSWIGSLFASKFLIESFVAEGSQGYVFRAQDTLLGRTVALKLVPGQVDAKRKARLMREAVALSRIRTEHAPIVYEAGLDSYSGMDYAVFEWLDGAQLSSLIGLPISEDQVLRLAASLAGALSAAHANGIVHRELHPAAVIVSPKADGSTQAKVYDFGLAKLEDEVSAGVQTNPGELQRYVGYLSPERARGSEPDQQSDVYALGAMLYELCTGALPYEGRFERLQAVEVSSKAPLPKARPGFALSPMLQAAVSRALSPDPQERFANAAKLDELLQAMLRERPLRNPRSITAVTVDQRNLHVVVGRADGSVEVYARDTGLQQMRWAAHRGPVTALTFRPDTEEFLSAGEDGYIQLFSISESCRAGTWPGLRGTQFTLAFSPHGYIFATGERNGRIRLWSLLEQRPLGELSMHQDAVTALHFLPEGRFLASASEDGTLLLWDVGSMTLAERATWNRGPVSHFAMHVRERFVVAFRDGSLAMSRWSSEAPLWHHPVHRGAVTRLFEQHGGQAVFSVGLDGAIHCTDVFDGSERRVALFHFEGIHTAHLHTASERLYVSNDSNLLRWTWGPNSVPILEGFLPEHGRSGWVS